MKTQMYRQLFRVLFPLAAAVALSPKVEAGAGVIDARQNCNQLNCGATTIVGHYIANQGDGVALPWTSQVLVGSNDCVRLEVASQVTDLRLTLTCADGTTWDNDDALPGNRSLIVARTRVAGWCTLTASHFQTGFENAGTTGNFTLRYGRYATNNRPNCVGLFTDPLSLPGSSGASARSATTKPANPSFDHGSLLRQRQR
ncbi:MAG: hypothetical protein ACT4PZ_04285 [Panacagrimonas sp.]